jgi:hypothetical protein
MNAEVYVSNSLGLYASINHFKQFVVYEEWG